MENDQLSYKKKGAAMATPFFNGTLRELVLHDFIGIHVVDSETYKINAGT